MNFNYKPDLALFSLFSLFHLDPHWADHPVTFYIHKYAFIIDKIY